MPDPNPRPDDLGRSRESCPDDYTIADRCRDELANGDGLDELTDFYDDEMPMDDESEFEE